MQSLEKHQYMSHDHENSINKISCVLYTVFIQQDCKFARFAKILCAIHVINFLLNIHIYMYMYSVWLHIHVHVHECVLHGLAHLSGHPYTAEELVFDGLC